MTEQIVVIGAALVDFIGHYRSNPSDPTLTNLMGTVKVSPGGAAFNIATNIAVRSAATCRLISYCPNESISGRIISAVCRSIDLRDTWVADDQIPKSEPAFVALFKDKKFETGVTSSPIEDAGIFNDNTIEHYIKYSSLVVAETNLNRTQISKIAELAARHRKPVCCMIVSQTKADRIKNLTLSEPFELVSLNESEANEIGHNLTLAEASGSDAICATLNAKVVIVTDSSSGYVVFRSGQAPIRVPAVRSQLMVNELGAGDALFSAACVSVLKREEIPGRDFADRIGAWTAAVLAREGANIIDKDISLDAHNSPNFLLDRGWAFVAGCVAILIIATITGRLGLEVFVTGVILTCAAGAFLGALTRSILDNDSSISKRTVLVGAIIGGVLGLLNVIPSWAVGDVPFGGGSNSINLAAPSAFFSSFLGSIAFEATLAALTGKRMDDGKFN